MIFNQCVPAVMQPLWRPSAAVNLHFVFSEVTSFMFRQNKKGHLFLLFFPPSVHFALTLISTFLPHFSLSLVTFSVLSLDPLSVTNCLVCPLPFSFIAHFSASLLPFLSPIPTMYTPNIHPHLHLFMTSPMPLFLLHTRTINYTPMDAQTIKDVMG